MDRAVCSTRSPDSKPEYRSKGLGNIHVSPNSFKRRTLGYNHAHKGETQMTAILSTEFWVVFQMMIILILITVLVYVIRNLKVEKGPEKGEIEERDTTTEAANKILALLEPLLNEAESAARVFESQIMEKKLLIRELNDKLDSRIISLNLLLNRADACLSSKSFNLNQDPYAGVGISDMQESILAMFGQGLDAHAISEKLSVARKEVDLVIALKKKFIAMEKEP